MPKIKITALVTRSETRLVSVSDEQLEKIEDGHFEDFAADCFENDVGEIVDDYHVQDQIDSWELATESEATHD